MTTDVLDKILNDDRESKVQGAIDRKSVELKEEMNTYNEQVK